MATTASANRVALRYIPEVTFGITPSTGQHTALRLTGESLNYNINTDTSKEIRADRNIADLIQLGAETSGDVQFELSYGTYDDFIAAALGGSWTPQGSGSTADDLKNGVVIPSYSIEKSFQDIGQNILFRGMSVNTMGLEFAVGSILTGSFGFIGRDSDISATSFLPVASKTVPVTEVLNAASNFSDLSIGGVSYPCGIGKISLSTDAGLRAQNSVGNMGACAINPGTLAVTGSFEVYFADGAIYSNYVANSPFELSWKITDAAGNSYTFLLPHVKVNSATVAAGGLDQDVALEVNYQALFDPARACSIMVTRQPA